MNTEETATKRKWDVRTIGTEKVPTKMMPPVLFTIALRVRLCVVISSDSILKSYVLRLSILSKYIILSDRDNSCIVHRKMGYSDNQAHTRTPKKLWNKPIENTMQQIFEDEQKYRMRTSFFSNHTHGESVRTRWIHHAVQDGLTDSSFGTLVSLHSSVLL